MFPTGKPGFALLILRVALAVMLVEGVAGRLLSLGSPWLIAAPGTVAVALSVGFITPVVAALTVVLEVTTWATTDGPVSAVHICAVLDAIALAMLGPGAYSLDARLFGRRQVILRSSDDSRHGGG